MQSMATTCRTRLVALLSPFTLNLYCCEPEEIAGTAVYFASKTASFITGQTIVVDCDGRKLYAFNRLS